VHVVAEFLFDSRASFVDELESVLLELLEDFSACFEIIGKSVTHLPVLSVELSKLEVLLINSLFEIVGDHLLLLRVVHLGDASHLLSVFMSHHFFPGFCALACLIIEVVNVRAQFSVNFVMTVAL
jgi:hypothetical protein